MSDVQVEVQPTPNINALKFVVNRRVTEGRSQTFTTPEQAAGSPLAQALLGVVGVRQVFFLNDFITVTREPDADWMEIAPKAEALIREHLGRA